MVEISLRTCFRDFNAPSFVFYLSVSIFSVLLILRIDEVIDIDYAFVFLPLWICGVLVIVGCFSAIVSYIYQPPPLAEIGLRWDFFAMIMSTIEHSILVVFEVLLYYKLRMIDGDEPFDPTITWSVVFAPLFGLAILAVTVMVWAVRFSKSFKFELFFSVNVIQFVFLALKLDNVVDWNWAIVFIPAWMVLAVCLIAVVYAVILAILLSRTMQMLPAHRRQHIVSAFCHFLVVVPMLVFMLLLTGRLDAIEGSNSTIPIHPTTLDPLDLLEPLTTTLTPLDAIPNLSTISIPLFVALAQLILLTFGSRGGNPWWFAMRKPFCNFIFGHSPCLQQYANISYKMGRSSSGEENESELLEAQRPEEHTRFSRLMVPIETLEAPD